MFGLWQGFRCSPPSEDSMQTMDILLVDDDKAYLGIVHDLLKTRGYALYTAHNGTDACSILESEEIDLIISDIKMPEMDGMKLHEHVRTLERYKNTKFIFLSAYREYATTVARLHKQTDFFFDKRMPHSDLLRFIDMLLFGKYAGTWV